MSQFAGAILAYFLVAVLFFGYTFLVKKEPNSLAGRIAFCLLWGVMLPMMLLTKHEEGGEDD